MTPEIFKKFQVLIKRESGIHLVEEKSQLLANRIQRRLRALNLGSDQEYLEMIETEHNEEELINLIDVVSTNVTFFYREHDHYIKLAEMLSEMQRGGKRKFRIWCAAASSGEEPYNLAMVCAETLRGADWKILGTDICTKVLRHAIEGSYISEQLKKLPASYSGKYFQQVGEDDFQIVQSLRERVIFKKLNLSVFPYKVPAAIDFVFCRNVMIYFDTDLRGKIVREFYRLLNPGGYLFLSHSENLLGATHSYKNLGHSIFQK